MAKLMRLTMTDQLNRLLRDIPVSVRESTKTDCIYLGKGVVNAGKARPDVTVRVFLRDGKPMVSVTSREVGLDLEGKFDTAEAQSAFPEAVRRAIVAQMN